MFSVFFLLSAKIEFIVDLTISFVSIIQYNIIYVYKYIEFFEYSKM